eukprot:5639403-Pyramimonas_sp.AAC.1
MVNECCEIPAKATRLKNWDGLESAAKRCTDNFGSDAARGGQDTNKRGRENLLTSHTLLNSLARAIRNNLIATTGRPRARYYVDVVVVVLSATVMSSTSTPRTSGLILTRMSRAALMKSSAASSTQAHAPLSPLSHHPRCPPFSVMTSAKCSLSPNTS